MALIVCAGCGQHHSVEAQSCPHCADRRSSSAPSPAALVLGLLLGAPGCDFGGQPLYGTTATSDKFPTSTGDTGADGGTTPSGGDTGA